VQAWVVAVLGVLALVTVGLKANRRFIADDQGLRGNGFGPRPLAYGDIEEINWEKWDEKGIIVLTLKSGRCIKLDGWHFSGMMGISDELRKHCPDLVPKVQETQEG
jgi:hypothetical protein